MNGILYNYSSSSSDSENDSKYKLQPLINQHKISKKKFGSLNEVLQTIPNSFVKQYHQRSDSELSDEEEMDQNRISIEKSLDFKKETFNAVPPPAHTLSIDNKNDISISNIFK